MKDTKVIENFLNGTPSQNEIFFSKQPRKTSTNEEIITDVYPDEETSNNKKPQKHFLRKILKWIWYLFVFIVAITLVFVFKDTLNPANIFSVLSQKEKKFPMHDTNSINYIEKKIKNEDVKSDRNNIKIEERRSITGKNNSSSIKKQNKILKKKTATKITKEKIIKQSIGYMREKGRSPIEAALIGYTSKNDDIPFLCRLKPEYPTGEYVYYIKNKKGEYIENPAQDTFSIYEKGIAYNFSPESNFVKIEPGKYIKRKIYAECSPVKGE